MFLVLFDCDGTLVDSQKTIVACMTNAFQGNGFDPPSRERILSIVGLSLMTAVARLAPDFAPAQIELVAQTYKAGFYRMRTDPAFDEPLFAGAAALIDRLSGRDDILLGIATGKSIRGVDHLLQKHGWEGRFATIQTADTNPSKPHPAMVLNAMRDTGIDARRCVLVGDTTYDMEMARDAGAGAIGVSWGYHPQDHLRDAGADHVLHHFDDLLPHLETRWRKAM